jgi:hypothetical protein
MALLWEAGMMIIAAELWAVDRVEDLAGDTITNIWQILTGWFDTYVLAAMLAILLLLVVVLVSRRRRT